MPALLFTCPSTRLQTSAGIETDVQSLRAMWTEKVKVPCTHCGMVHEILVREVYIEGVLNEAADALRRVS
jgi:hypothetical protein